MIVDDSGRLSFVRGDHVVLESAPAFVLAYNVELSAQAALSVERSGDRLAIRYGTLDPSVSLELEAEATASGFRLRWSCAPNLPAVGVAWALKPQGPWYGHGQRVIQPWPLDRLPLIAEPLIPYDNGRGGSSCITTPLWFNAAGAALLAGEESGELDMTLDRGGDGLLRVVARLPEPTAASNLDAPLPDRGPLLALDILLADDVPAAHALAIGVLGHPTSAPPPELIARPIWTTWARYKMAVTQADVLEFAEDIVARGYPRSVMEIDDRWQLGYGECAWDRAKFPDPRAMIDRLHELGFKVTLWMPPFFDPRGAAFAEAAAQGFLVRDPASGAPAVVRWWQGYGGLIDVTNPAALAWWRAQLGRLQQQDGVDGFKFDAGEGNYVPRDRVTAQPLLPHQYADHYVAWVAEHFAWTEVRSGWRAQRNGILFREWDKWSRWGIDNGLHSVLTGALALSMVGYPFVLPDMIGGNAYAGEEPDAELLVRWTQLSALLPALQFSIPPWAFDDATDAICLRYSQLHEQIAPYIQSQIDETLRSGAPLVRPLFWHAPHDQATLAIDDQYLLGERLLVAPVLQPGQRARDIYLPAGRWRDWWSDEVVEGPCWLTQHPAPLETLPLFEQVDRT
ncbi:MAG: glycoside hydrolase [Kouleothrix sp.]|nr:glycoside hydrolase [Kouleothrix sp.]